MSTDETVTADTSQPDEETTLETALADADESIRDALETVATELQATQDRLAAVEAENDELRKQVVRLQEDHEEALRLAEGAKQVAKRAIQTANAYDDDLDELEAYFDAELEIVRSDVDDLRDRTRIFEHVQDASTLDMDTRAALCIQAAYNEAQDDPNGRGTLTVREGWTRLNRSIDRTRIYDVFDTAEELLGDDDLCWFQREPRGHDPPSRLIIDLSTGRLPTRVKGVGITEDA